MIGKLRVVLRVVLFSAVPDTVAGLGAPTWETTHANPVRALLGAGHDRDPAFSAIRAGWDTLGMDTFGPAVIPKRASRHTTQRICSSPTSCREAARLASPTAALSVTTLRHSSLTELPPSVMLGDTC